MNNKIQISHVNIFYIKSIFEMLKLFKKNFDIIQHEFNRCIRIRINNDFKFMNNVFVIFRNKQNIRVEFIIVNNFQMNSCAKRFNRILIRKINIFLKNFKLSLK